MALESQTYVEYEMRVIVKRPVTSWQGGDTPKEIAESAAWMRGFAATSELEREIVRALRVLDGDCTAETVSAKACEE